MRGWIQSQLYQPDYRDSDIEVHSTAAVSTADKPLCSVCFFTNVEGCRTYSTNKSLKRVPRYLNIHLNSELLPPRYRHVERRHKLACALEEEDVVPPGEYPDTWQ